VLEENNNLNLYSKRPINYLCIAYIGIFYYQRKNYTTYLRDGDHLSVRFRIPGKQKKKHFNKEGAVFLILWKI